MKKIFPYRLSIFFLTIYLAACNSVTSTKNYSAADAKVTAGTHLFNQYCSGCTENGYAFLAHSKEKVWGTVLRIDPSGNNSANGKYGIPAQNLFVKNKNALGEIYV